MAPISQNNNANKSIFDDDEEGWEDMPVVRDDFANGLDDEDRKRYHYVTPTSRATENATGNLIDFDDKGQGWREKADTNESEYTRLRLTEDNDNDEVHLRTKYLFDEDKAMTPLSQMQATKNLLTEAQRIAYVGLCALVSREMSAALKHTKSKELKPAIESLELWVLKIMGRLYYHMELETQEQKMIDSLAEHGVQAMDLAPSLMTTHTVANPEYDPVEARRLEKEREHTEAEDEQSETVPTPTTPSTTVTTPTISSQTTTNVLASTTTVSVPGVSTSLSAADKDITLDIRWTVLCDLFLVLIADSVYDARSRVLLESVAAKLGLSWLDVVKFEQRVTEALEIQEGVEHMEQKDVIENRMKAAKAKRYAMMGLATIGGGLVIGLSAGLAAPVIGLGLGTILGTIGITGTTGFLAGAGGVAVITTAATVTGSSIGARGMARRTQHVRTFALLPLHNNKRVNCILTVSGFMTSSKDDVRLPFSVLDPIVGDVFSVLWEPEMLGETGSALKILTSEVLSTVGQTVLQATIMGTLMGALQLPILLTKLGYLIDNPWSNALDRARAAGAVLADVLIERHLGVRPITLIGFSLGARLIFYCLLELAKKKAFGIVQDVFMLGATLTASRQSWLQARSVVSGRFVNGYARNDWVLNYLFRATSGGLNSIAGLRPVQDVPGLENVDVTDKIAGHMSYRSFMPLILDQLGFPVSADYFDEPEEPDFEGDRVVIREDQQPQKKSWFSRKSKPATPRRESSVSGHGVTSSPKNPTTTTQGDIKTNNEEEDLPERLEHSRVNSDVSTATPPGTPGRSQEGGAEDVQNPIPTHAGFDLNAIQSLIKNEAVKGTSDAQGPQAHSAQAQRFDIPNIPPPSLRSESAPPPELTNIPGSDRFSPTRSPSLSARPSLEGASPRTYATSGHAREGGGSPGNDLSTNFARSVSLAGPSSFVENKSVPSELEKGRVPVTQSTSIATSNFPNTNAQITNDTETPENYTYLALSGRGSDLEYSSSMSTGFTPLGSTVRSWQSGSGVDNAYSSTGGFGGGLGYGLGLSRTEASTSSASRSIPELSFGGVDGSIWGASDTYRSNLDNSLGLPSTSGRDPLAVSGSVGLSGRGGGTSAGAASSLYSTNSYTSRFGAGVENTFTNTKPGALMFGVEHGMESYSTGSGSSSSALGTYSVRENAGSGTIRLPHGDSETYSHHPLSAPTTTLSFGTFEGELTVSGANAGLPGSDRRLGIGSGSEGGGREEANSSTGRMNTPSGGTNERTYTTSLIQQNPWQ